MADDEDDEEIEEDEDDFDDEDEQPDEQPDADDVSDVAASQEDKATSVVDNDSDANIAETGDSTSAADGQQLGDQAKENAEDNSAKLMDVAEDAKTDETAATPNADSENKDVSDGAVYIVDEAASMPIHELAAATRKEVAYAASEPRKANGIDIGSIEVMITFDLGDVRLSMRDLESLKEGYTFTLERANDEFVTLRANGMQIGRGRLVDIDGRIGVQIEHLND